MAGTARWDPPGPGAWVFDRSHLDRPLTRFGVLTGREAQLDALAAGFARVGIAIGRSQVAVVNGFNYGAQRWASAERYADLEIAAKDFVANRRWVEQLEAWEHELRPAMTAEWRGLSTIDVAQLSDSELIEHLDACVASWAEAAWVHFTQHALCVLIGELVVACRQWGIADADVLPLLEGASSASAAAAAQLEHIAAALREAGVRPSSLEDIERASPAAAHALANYLLDHGLQVVAGFDYSARTLLEMPGVIVASVLAVLDGVTAPASADPTAVRDAVPEADRGRFDALLADARSVYGLRDDDVRFAMWSRGLARRALLEAGRRLASRGQLRDPAHVLDLGPDEIRALLLEGAAVPTPAEAAEWANLRHARAALDPPPTLGDAPVPPPLADMPATVRRLTAAMAAYMQLRRPRRDAVHDRLCGVGIGTEASRGRAVVAADADDAFDRLAPGDILVTVLTTPSFNGVLPMCGGLVVEDAGLLSHAAVTARELGLPAVLGVDQATRLIPDGAEVEIDPASGRVAIVG